jgi:hypothetical protein
MGRVGVGEKGAAGDPGDFGRGRRRRNFLGDVVGIATEVPIRRAVCRICQKSKFNNDLKNYCGDNHRLT